MSDPARDDAPGRKYDLYSHATMADPHPVYAAMRRDDPVHCQIGLDGRTPIWFVSRYDDVEAVLRDDRRFVRDPRLAGHEPPMDAVWELLSDHMLNRDGDEHRRLRTLVSQAFTPKRVAALRPRVEAIAAALLEPVRARGEMDLIGDFALPLPTIVILELLGVPTEDRERFRAWSNALLEPRLDPEGQQEAARLLGEFVAYLRELFAARRADPRDDLLTALLQAEAEGDRLSESELFGTMVLLIVAGHETTVNLIANAVLTLLRRPDALARLREEPAGLPDAIEEVLRFEGSVERALNRFAAEDVELGGRLIRRGEPVILILAAADRDPARFEDPDRFDPARRPNRHLGFGKGPHYCLGAPLARLETEVALAALLRELPGLRLATPPGELRWRMLPGFRALAALPVAWTP